MPTSGPKVLCTSNVFYAGSNCNPEHSEVWWLLHSRHCHHCLLFHMYLPTRETPALSALRLILLFPPAHPTTAPSGPRRIPPRFPLLPLPLLPSIRQAFVRSVQLLLS